MAKLLVADAPSYPDGSAGKPCSAADAFLVNPTDFGSEARSLSFERSSVDGSAR